MLSAAVFDDDGNGSISVDELRHVMYGLVDRLTDDEVEGMVRQADSEGSGEITFHGTPTSRWWRGGGERVRERRMRYEGSDDRINFW